MQSTRPAAFSRTKCLLRTTLVLFPCLMMVLLAIPSSSPQRQASAATGELLICSATQEGTWANKNCYYPSMSKDGKYTAFSSSATNLVAGDVNGNNDIFLKDLSNGSIHLCSTDSGGVQANGSSSYASVDLAGEKVVFMSSASNLVPGDVNGKNDIFCKDISSGAITRCSTDSSGNEADDASSSPMISSDGRYVVFQSAATNLVTGDTNGKEDIFKKDFQTGQIIRCSQSALLGEGNDISECPAVDDDGSAVTFTTTATNLFSGDANGKKDVVQYDCATGNITCCSADSAGSQGNGDSTGQSSMSSDGRYVCFISESSNLAAGDNNGGTDTFRKDLSTGEVLLCSTDAGGTQRSFSVPRISGDGRYVAFSSSYQFVKRSVNYHSVYRKDLITGEVLDCSATTEGDPSGQHANNPVISGDGSYVTFAWYYKYEGQMIFRKEPLHETSYMSALSPGSGFSGTEVSITGEKFGATRGTGYVTFGGVQASEYSEWTDTLVKAIVPRGVGGDVAVRLTNALGRSNALYFEIPLPRITGVDPHDSYFEGYGYPGSEVTISGANFQPSQGGSYVSFGSIQAVDYISWSNDKIVVKVPDGVSLGKCGIRVTTESGSYFQDDFSIRPLIISLDKEYGEIGSIVRLTGACFGDDPGKVYFSTIEADEILLWSDKEIDVRIPYSNRYPDDSAVGICVMGVVGSGQYMSQGVQFEIVPYVACLAEGYTGPGFQEYLCIGNATKYPAEVTIYYLLPDNYYWDQKVTVPAKSRTTVNVNAEVPGMEVSAYIESDVEVVVERPMYFDYGGGWTGGHDAVASKYVSRNWFFAEGYTGAGFDEWVCVLNVENADANLTFHFQTLEAGEVIKNAVVPRFSRVSFRVNDLLGPDYQCSLWLESDRMVVAERSMYFDYTGRSNGHWEGGHCVMGFPYLSNEYYFAEGTTRSGFEEWLTVQNPHDHEISVTALFQMQAGAGDPVTRTFGIAPGSRATLYVPDEVGPEKDVSVKLTCSEVFLAERPMYFRYLGVIEGGHCVIGATEASGEWFFAEGYTGDNFNEWLCLQNPGSEESTVEVTYLVKGSGAMAPKAVKVPAGSRLTILVNSHAGSGLELSTELKVTSGPDVVAERPMYFSYYGMSGGHDVVGYAPDAFSSSSYQSADASGPALIGGIDLSLRQRKQ